MPKPIIIFLFILTIAAQERAPRGHLSGDPTTGPPSCPQMSFPFSSCVFSAAASANNTLCVTACLNILHATPPAAWIYEFCAWNHEGRESHKW